MEQYRPALMAMVRAHARPELGIEVDDLHQIALDASWRSITSGVFNPYRGNFGSFVATSVRHKLINYVEATRAAHRGGGRRAESIEQLSENGVDICELGSWVSFIDPCRVVIARDTLRRAWEVCTELEQAAIRDYMTRSDAERPLPVSTIQAVYRARRRVRPMLAE